jgi:Predicted dehydrogenases and related proteins
MLKIAVVDHHLNNFHADKYSELLRGPLAGEEAALTVAYESHPTGDDWCAKHGVRRADTVEEAVREADAVLLLAPNDVDTHPALAANVLPAGKPVFLDKMLAADTNGAREIVTLARRHGAPIYSCSALRHAREVEEALAQIARSGETVTEVVARGMGKWDHYGVHTVAMALRLMGRGSAVRRVADSGSDAARWVTLDFGGERRAHLDVRAAENEWEVFSWTFAARTGNRYVAGKVADYDGFYHDQLKAVLDFFRTGEPPAPPEEALDTVAVIEGAERSRRADGAWISLDAA